VRQSRQFIMRVQLPRLMLWKTTCSPELRCTHRHHLVAPKSPWFQVMTYLESPEQRHEVIYSSLYAARQNQPNLSTSSRSPLTSRGCCLCTRTFPLRPDAGRGGQRLGCLVYCIRIWTWRLEIAIPHVRQSHLKRETPY